MSGSPKALFVTHNLGSLAVVGRIAKAAKAAGWKVYLFAYGPSAAVAEKNTGIMPDPDNGLMPDNVVELLKPDVVVVGCSYPQVDPERQYLLAAEPRNIPGVIVSDVPGAWKRLLDIKRALILTTDGADADAAYFHGFPDSFAVGMHQVNVPPPSEETERVVAEQHALGKKVILYASSGQPTRVAQELQCVLACSALTTVPHALIHQPNPKIVPLPHPERGTWGEWLENEALAGNAVTLKGPFVLYADMTISPSSSGLTAAAAGNIGVGLRTATVEDIMAKESGVLEMLDFLEKEVGLPIIREPMDLAYLFETPRPKIDVKSFDTELALGRIKEYVGIK